MVSSDGNNKMIDLPWEANISNSTEDVSFGSQPRRVENDITLDLSSRVIGEDGYFYECVICDNGGNLLCCDTCPCTYHLQCLSPPLECVPPGNWQCPKCCEKDYLSKRNFLSSKTKQVFSHTVLSLSTKKKLGFSTNASAYTKTSSPADENLPADPFHLLHELSEVAGQVEKTMASEDNVLGEEQQKAVDQIDDGKRTETCTKVNETKVYRRYRSRRTVRKELRVRDSSKIINEVQDEPAVSTTRLVNCLNIQSRSSEHADGDLDNDIPSSPNQPIEQNEKAAEEQGVMQVFPSVIGDICAHWSQENEHDQLLLVRDVRQVSVKGNNKPIQNGNEEREPRLELDTKYTHAGQAIKEKFVKLRARQKKRLGLRYTSQEPCRMSGLVGPEPLIQIPTFIESAGQKASANVLKLHKSRKPITTRNRETGRKVCLGISSNQGSDGTSCFQNLSIRPHSKRPYQRPTKTDKQLPDLPSHQALDAGCSMSGRQAIPGDSLYILYPSTEPRGSHSSEGQIMVDAWFEEELDALWIGVCRYGQGNWEAILRDPTLNFSNCKTSEDLSIRWNKERQKILNSEEFPGQQSTNSLQPGTSYNSVTSSNILPCRLQEAVFVPEGQSQVVLAQVISRGGHRQPTNLRDLKKMYRLPMPFQPSPATAEASKSFHLEKAFNRLPLGAEQGARQNLLLGGSFQLPEVGMVRNESGDSGETESDPSLMERCEGMEISSEGTLSD